MEQVLKIFQNFLTNMTVSEESLNKVNYIN